MSDLERALKNPESVFNTPQAVLGRDDFSTAEKIQVLRRWEYDAREMQVAEEENMGGGVSSGILDDKLDEILEALHALEAGIDLEHSPPTKQGGE